MNEDAIHDIKSSAIEINNAGLCLMSPWFSWLFYRLGYLNKDKNDFNNNPSKIRAMFVLQHIVCIKDREYNERELSFNRMLVSLPMDVPVPTKIELTEEEMQIADRLLLILRNYFPLMRTTPIEGFRNSFIERKAIIEEQDDNCILRVKDMTYDLLLEGFPVSFKQIKYPWLKKYFQVIWHEKPGLNFL